MNNDKDNAHNQVDDDHDDDDNDNDRLRKSRPSPLYLVHFCVLYFHKGKIARENEVYIYLLLP
jgi:hypothetical protein